MSISQLAYDCIKRELGIMAEKIATLQSQLSASQERERILREGLGGIRADQKLGAHGNELPIS